MCIRPLWNCIGVAAALGMGWGGLGCGSQGGGQDGTDGDLGSGGGAPGASGGSGGAMGPGGVDVFVEIEDCARGEGFLRGTVDGRAVDDAEMMTNWRRAILQWGMGETDGVTWEFALSMSYDHFMAPLDPSLEWEPPVDFAALEDFRDTAALTGGWYYRAGSDSETSVFYCITDGVIGQHTRTSEVPPTLLKWRVTGARRERDCSGEPVSIDLRGCVARENLVAP